MDNLVRITYIVLNADGTHRKFKLLDHVSFIGGNGRSAEKGGVVKSWWEVNQGWVGGVDNYRTGELRLQSTQNLSLITWQTLYIWIILYLITLIISTL